ncbi:MAG: hypothetical protein M3441_15950 [Chloroflexota bacterium]|nr:hypothetical protein [Chloroflexota bacterium]
MEIESLSCQKCGGPLDVPTSADFVTCGYCGSALAVRRNGSAHYTELLERLEQHTQYLAGRTEYLRLRDEVEALDAEWQRERRRYLMRRLSGSLRAPTRTYLSSSIAVAVAACALTAWWFYATANAGSGASFFGWIGAVLSLAAVVNAVRVSSKVNGYKLAKEVYRQRRDELLKAMHAAYPQEVPLAEYSPLAGSGQSLQR